MQGLANLQEQTCQLVKSLGADLKLKVADVVPG